MTEFSEWMVSFFRDVLLFALVAIVLENTIFSRALGVSTSLYLVRKEYSVPLVGLIMTTIITLASLGAYFINPLIRYQAWSYYAAPVIYVGIVAVIYVAALLITRRFVKKRLTDVLSIIHVSAFNCASLGAILLVSSLSDATLGAYLGFAIGSGLGFTLATYLVRLAYHRLSSEDVPAAFRGFPVTLIYIGLVSLAIYGLIGHQLPY